MTVEQWRPVAGFESQYEVSDLGNVRSIDRTVRNRWGTVRPVASQPLCIQISREGYSQVLLSRDGKSIKRYIHRLVAAAFLPNPENLPQVNHMDGDKQRNAVGNLEWMTCRANSLHARENRLYEQARGAQMSRKLTDNDVREIRRQASAGVFHKSLAEAHGISRQQITKIVNRQRWQHVI